jgi:E3 ubiquitin-protein ligase DOA10
MIESPIFDNFLDENVCRICRLNEDNKTLCNVCGCTGSMGFIHLECLEEWIKSCKSKNRNWESFFFLYLFLDLYFVYSL